MDTQADLAVNTNSEDWEAISARYVDRRLVAGSVALMTGGLVIWLTGATSGTFALVSGCRRYLAAREEPPKATARRRWGQTKMAVGAGFGAWQNYNRP